MYYFLENGIDWDITSNNSPVIESYGNKYYNRRTKQIGSKTHYEGNTTVLSSNSPLGLKITDKFVMEATKIKYKHNGEKVYKDIEFNVELMSDDNNNKYAYFYRVYEDQIYLKHTITLNSDYYRVPRKIETYRNKEFVNSGSIWSMGDDYGITLVKDYTKTGIRYAKQRIYNWAEKNYEIIDNCFIDKYGAKIDIDDIVYVKEITKISAKQFVKPEFII